MLVIQLAPAKADLLHLIPLSSQSLVAPEVITVGATPISGKISIKILGIWVDQRLSFSKHVDLAAFKLAQNAACLKAIARSKDLSPAAMYHVATATAIPTMLWGSPTWWTGALSVIDHLAPAYHSLARSICQAKSYTRTSMLLYDAGLPPLDLLLDQASQRYGIRILLYDPPHPLAGTLFEALRQAAGAPLVSQSTGLRPIT